MDEASREWLAAIATALAVLIALFGPTVWAWWRRPLLKISYEPGEPFCRNTLMPAEEDPKIPVKAQWIRVKVTNKGRSTAKRCQGKMTAVYTGNGKLRGDRDSMLLRWSLAGASEEGQLQALDLARGDWDFLSVIYATERQTDAVFIATSPETRPGFRTVLEAGQEHRVTVAVYGDNAEPVRRDFVITYGGTVDSLKMRPAGT